MLTDATPHAQQRRELWLVLGICIAVFVAKLFMYRADIREWAFPDPDDAMRLLQVRDWLAGQSWFDVTQYRLNPPFGAPMHWSRLIDLPIAAVILIARPVLGPQGGEMAALLIVPTVTMGLAMLIIYKIAAKLADGSAPLLAAAAAPASLGAITQMRLLRIDHHGWQIVLALAASLAVLDAKPRRSAMAAGAAIGLWLNISIEALPFATALGAWFAIEWLRDGSATERVKTYTITVAAVAAALFAATHLPSAWLSLPHDALNVSHLAALGAAGGCCALVVRSTIADWRVRAAALGLAAVASAGAMFGIDPHALQGPFSSLDPIVQRIWYSAVDEGLPVWKLSFKDAAVALSQQAVGLAGACAALRRCAPEQRERWRAYTYLLGCATLCSAAVVREATMASMLALPGTAYLCGLAFVRARALSMVPVRIVATVAALLIMTPAYAVPVTVQPAGGERLRQQNSSDGCLLRSETEKLNALPTSTLAIPLDITPAILTATQHRAVGSGHHRNVTGIRDMILLFVQTPDKGPVIIARRHIDYVVFCPRTAETLWWEQFGPHGLAAMLNRGRSPDWLEPVAVPGLHALKVWRVRSDRIAAHG